MANETKTTVKNAQVKIAQVNQTGDNEFGLEEKKLNYVLIMTDKGQVKMNIGETKYNNLKEILK